MRFEMNSATHRLRRPALHGAPSFGPASRALQPPAAAGLPPLPASITLV